MTGKVYQNFGNPSVLDQIKGEHLEILDVGCGAGDNAILLRNKGHQVDGITHAEEEVKICQGKMRKVIMHDLSLGLPQNLGHHYDFVICSHVLEHIAYPEPLLKDIRSVMKENGRLIIALPNLMHYKSRMKLLAGKFDYADTGIWDNTHLRWYTFTSAKNLFERNGYDVISAWVDGEIPALRVMKFLPVRIRSGIFRMLTGISKGFFGGQLLYIAKAKDTAR